MKISDLTSPDIISLILEQVGVYRSQYDQEPNMVALGMDIVNKLNDEGGYFHKESKFNNELYLGDYKVFFDGHNDNMIAVGYTPFIYYQDKII